MSLFDETRLLHNNPVPTVPDSMTVDIAGATTDAAAPDAVATSEPASYETESPDDAQN